MINFKLDGRIIPKARPRVFKKRAYLPQNYRAWKDASALFFQKELKRQGWTNFWDENGIDVSIVFIGKHKGDLDNLAGAILDALVDSGVIPDDSLKWVKKLSAIHLPGETLFTEINLSPFHP